MPHLALSSRSCPPVVESEADPNRAEDGRSKALGIEIRQAEPSDDDLNLQRQVAEQMLLGALRERGLAEDAEAARRRASFLAEASHLLAQSVDHASTLVALTKMALPALGAWRIVDVLQGRCDQSPLYLSP